MGQSASITRCRPSWATKEPHCPFHVSRYGCLAAYSVILAFSAYASCGCDHTIPSSTAT